MATIKVYDADGKEYNLAFTLRTIKYMSNNGFNVEEAKNDSIFGIPRLFAGAFLVNHRDVKEDKIDEIWANIEDKEGFSNALISMFNEPIEKLYSEPEDDSKKAKWEVVR